MLIRNFTPEDREQYLKLATDFFTSPALLHPLDPATIQRSFDQAISNPECLRGVFLESDGQTAGFAFLTFCWSTEKGGKVVWVEDLYIVPEFRGKQLGSQFFQWLEREYSEKPCRFSLEVAPTNPAIRLYERLGYRKLEYYRMIKEGK